MKKQTPELYFPTTILKKVHIKDIHNSSCHNIEYIVNNSNGEVESHEMAIVRLEIAEASRARIREDLKLY